MFPYGTYVIPMASCLFFNGEDQVLSMLKNNKVININRREGKQSEYPDSAMSFACLHEFFVAEEGPPGY